jgi:hypothetical protein
MYVCMSIQVLHVLNKRVGKIACNPILTCTYGKAISQIVLKGGYEQRCSLVFLGIPPAASQGALRSPMFVAVRWWLSAFLSWFLSGFIE